LVYVFVLIDSSSGASERVAIFHIFIYKYNIISRYFYMSQIYTKYTAALIAAQLIQ